MPRTFLPALALGLPFIPATTTAADPCADYRTRVVQHTEVSIGGVMNEAVQVGNHLFAAVDNSTLAVFNVANPLQPFHQGDVPLPQTAVSLATDGSVLYVGGWRTGTLKACVTSVDVTGVPSLISTLEFGVQTWERVEHLALEGNILYASALGDGLFLLDVTDPANMTVRSNYAPPDCEVTGTAIDPAYPGRAYVTRDGDLGTQGGLAVLYVANPDAPIQAGFDDVYPERSLSHPVVDGSHVYSLHVNGPYSGKIFRHDVSSPTNPTEVARWSDVFATRLRKDGARLYATGRGNGAGTGFISVYDLSDPSVPALGHLLPHGGPDILFDPPYAYVTADYWSSGGLQVLEILEETTIFPTTDVQVGNGGAFPGDILDLGIHGTTAVQMEDTIVNGYPESGVRTLDFTDPTAPLTISLVNTTEILLRGDSRADLAVATSGRGLETLTVSPLAFVGSVVIAGAVDVALSGDYAYVSTSASGIQIVDVSDPSLPAVIGSEPVPGAAGELGVAGSHLFAADGADGLRIYDLSDPAAPAFLASPSLPEGADGVTVAGTLAFVRSSTTGGLHVVDVSSPAAPALLGSGVLKTGSTRLATADGHGFLYAVFDEGLGLTGFQVVDVTDPAAPVVLETIHQELIYAIDHVALVEDAILRFSSDHVQCFPLPCGAVPVAAPVAAAPAVPQAVLPVPNPFTEWTELRLARPAGSPGFLTVHDVRGRLLRRLTYGKNEPARWDGRDSDGRAVAPGVYFVRLSDAGGRTAAVSRVVRLR